MDLLIDEINKMRQMREDWRNGKITGEDADRLISITETINRLMLTGIKGMNIETKSKKASKDLRNMGFMGGGDSVDFSRQEIEAGRVRCPNNGRLITRADCLSFSGQNHDKCVACDHRAETVSRLLSDG